jgi:hypothetical protein
MRDNRDCPFCARSYKNLRTYSRHFASSARCDDELMKYNADLRGISLADMRAMLMSRLH